MVTKCANDFCAVCRYAIETLLQSPFKPRPENLLIQTSYRSCAHLIPISSGYRTDLVSILLCSNLGSQRAGTTSASVGARQPKAGSFPPFCEFSLHPPTWASSCDVVVCEVRS